jgi:hypothetical protein
MAQIGQEGAQEFWDVFPASARQPLFRHQTGQSVTLKIQASEMQTLFPLNEKNAEFLKLCVDTGSGFPL